MESADRQLENEDMEYTVQTEEGLCEVKGIRFIIDKKFTAGTYIITVRDVTKGLPPRMLMKNMKILFKIVDLTVEEQHQEVSTNQKGAPAKKPPAGKK